MLKIIARENNFVNGEILDFEYVVSDCWDLDESFQEAAVASGNPVAWMRYSWEEKCCSYFEYLAKKEGWSAVAAFIADLWSGEDAEVKIISENKNNLLLEVKSEDFTFYYGFEMEA